MDSVIVVGGGISGVACAQIVAKAGLDVVLLERGRSLGGRMAIAMTEGRPVDTGASYFTVSDDVFASVVDTWAERGLAHQWTDTFEVFEDGQPMEPKTGSDRWAAALGLRLLVEDLARGLAVERHTVQAVTLTGEGHSVQVDGRGASAVALAMPDPQARRLLDPKSPTVATLDDPFVPVLALSAGWDTRCWGPLDRGGAAAASIFEGAFVNGDDDVAWIADDGQRRGDGAAVLVAHSTPTLASAYLNSPQEATSRMLKAVTTLLGISEQPRWTDMHRWSFARPTGGHRATYHLGEDNIGVCGDAWSQRPRVEAAYLSGVALGAAIVQRLN